MNDISETLSDIPAGVTPLIAALLAITTPMAASCSEDDFNRFNSIKRDAAKSTADDFIAKQTNHKTAATDEYNAANEEII